MNKILKMSMLAALTMSSASVFAAAGDPVTGGSGTVSIAGTVQINTCAVAVDKTSLTATILKADFDSSGSGVDLTSTGDKTTTFTLNNCNGQPIKVLIKPTSGSVVVGTEPYWSIPGVQQIALRLQTPVGGITGGSWASMSTGNPWTSDINYTHPGLSVNGMRLDPDADTTTFPVIAHFGKIGPSNATYTGPSTFTIGYTYNLTYL